VATWLPADRFRDRGGHRAGAGRLNAVVDTNVLIFDTFEDSEFHAEATATLDSSDRWFIPGIVFHELIWFFRSRGIPVSKAKQKVEEYLTNEKSSFLSCTTDDLRFASVRMRGYPEYNDLVVLAAAKRLELPLLTFDEELRGLASRNSVRLLK
jgi:predicted nucleic acid-binding protein